MSVGAAGRGGAGTLVVSLPEPVAEEGGECVQERVEQNKAATVLEEEGWARAWHGTKLEALYSQIMFG